MPDNPTDIQIVANVRSLYQSPLMNQIRQAHANGNSVLVQIGNYSVQYEPLPFSGMTAFPAGFVIGREAFLSEDEFRKTLLHEVYRLCHSEIGRGAGAHQASVGAERDAAFRFAEQYYHMI